MDACPCGVRILRGCLGKHERSKLLLETAGMGRGSTVGEPRQKIHEKGSTVSGNPHAGVRHVDLCVFARLPKNQLSLNLRQNDF